MKITDYNLLNQQIQAIAETDQWYVPLLSNTSAMIYETMQDINWAGFYILRDGRLVLGPFQGRLACIHIGIGKGVCGTAVKENRVIRVADVHAFPGHIACDAASRSEIVLPIYHDGDLFGVLDIDSPEENRFSEDDEKGLKVIAETLSRLLKP